MFRRQIHVRAAQGERDFRWRGGDVSRIEGLTDGVFALAIALLVISVHVPRSFEELREAFVQTPVFLACFAILFLCWHAHFQFHRRYGLEDALTVFYNAALIFVVALYVYPLKFLFGQLWNGIVLRRGPYVLDAAGVPLADLDGAPGELLRSIRFDDMPDLMVLYGLGYAAVFGLYALMTWHAWGWRDRLDLDERERCVTRGTLRAHLISVGFGLGSVLVVLVTGSSAAAGFLYFGLGPAQGWNGWRQGRAVERLRPAKAGIGPDENRAAP